MKRQDLILLLLVIGLVAAKLYIINLSDSPAYDAYYGMRQVDHIKETGLPLIVDELSYQGRVSFTNPLSYYILTFFSFFMPVSFLFKYGGVLLAVAILFLIYLIATKLYKNKWVALLLAALAALNPTIFQTHSNTLVPSALFVVIYLLLLYSFIEKKHVLFISLIVVSTLMSSLNLVLVLGCILYFILLKLENLTIKKTEFELLFFSAVFIIWYNLIAFKKLFFTLGAQSIWQNIPQEIQLSIFSGLTVSGALALIGIVPLALGIYGIYSTLFERRNRQVLFFISFSFAFGILTWLGFLQLKEGLLYTIVTLILVSGYSILRIDNFFKKTVAPWATTALVSLLILISLLSFTTVFIYADSSVSQSPSNDELETFFMIEKLVPQEETVLTHIKQGHALSAISMRKNFYDEHYVLAPRASQRYIDARSIYLSQSQATVLGTLHQYGVRYIMTSKLTEKEYPTTISLFDSSECFDTIFETTTTKVYKVQCKLRT